MKNDVLYSLNEVTRAVRVSKHTFLQTLRESDQQAMAGGMRSIPSPASIVYSQMNDVRRFWTKQQLRDIVASFHGDLNDFSTPQIPEIDSIVKDTLQELTENSIYIAHTGFHDYGLGLQETEALLKSLLLHLYGKLTDDQFAEKTSLAMREKLFTALNVRDVIFEHEINVPMLPKEDDEMLSVASHRTIAPEAETLLEVSPKEYKFYFRGSNFGNLAWVVDNEERQVYCASEAACHKIISLAKWLESGATDPKPVNNIHSEKKAFYLVYGLHKALSPEQTPILHEKTKRGRPKTIQNDLGNSEAKEPRKRGRPKGSKNRKPRTETVQVGNVTWFPPRVKKTPSHLNERRLLRNRSNHSLNRKLQRQNVWNDETRDALKKNTPLNKRNWQDKNGGKIRRNGWPPR